MLDSVEKYIVLALSNQDPVQTISMTTETRALSGPAEGTADLRARNFIGPSQLRL